MKREYKTLCLLLFFWAIAVTAGAASGKETKGADFSPYWYASSGSALSGNQGASYGSDWATSETSYFLAQAGENAETPVNEAAKEESEVCRAFAEDPDANIGEIIKAGCQPSLAQMSKLMDNPLGNVAMLFTQFDVYEMENKANGETATKSVYTGIAQFPKKLNKDWNLINRVIWTVPSMPLDQDKIDRASGGPGNNFGEAPGATLPPSGSDALPINLFDGRTTGFGDMYYVGLFAPSEGKKLDSGGSLLWGAGFDLGLPTASEDILGTGKWTAGPSALGVYMGPKWKIGGLVMHYWDYAGDSDRDDVNLTNFQYFIYYSLSDTTSIGASPNIIANWEQNSDNAFTVPVGLGINRTFQFGKVPVRIGFEVHYSVVQPDDVPGSEWDFRLFIIPAAPSALFDWMN
jgi:hypothetical protein